MWWVALVYLTTHHVIKHEQALEAFRRLFHLGQCLFVRKLWLQNLLIDLFHQRTQQLTHIRLLAHAHPQDLFELRAHLVVIDNFDCHRSFACVREVMVSIV